MELFFLLQMLRYNDFYNKLDYFPNVYVLLKNSKLSRTLRLYKTSLLSKYRDKAKTSIVNQKAKKQEYVRTLASCLITHCCLILSKVTDVGTK